MVTSMILAVLLVSLWAGIDYTPETNLETK